MFLKKQLLRKTSGIPDRSATPNRDRDTVPQGMYMYEVRHDDDQQGEPVQIANWIMVNHLGNIDFQ